MPDLGAALAGWLRENQQPDGRILDPVHGEHGTYADGFAALAFGLMTLRTGEPGWAAACRRSLAVARRRPRTSEFDQLALLLLTLEVEKAGRDRHQLLGVEGQRPLTAATLPLDRGWRLVSNNWVAMRAVNYALRARLAGDPRDRNEADRLWERVLGWQQADGLFIDSPVGVATPVTYHAKFCAMLAMALTETESGSPALRPAFERGMEALADLVSPAGVLVPYGRSRHALFGYVAAIFAFRQASEILHQALYREMAARLESRVRRFQAPDGHVPCVLNGGEATRLDWDVYVNNPDYNGYAAALLLLSNRTVRLWDDGAAERAGMGDGHRQEEARETVVRQRGPLLTVRRGGLFAAVVTAGQSAPYGTPFFCDHRYYGLQPLWIERDGRALLEPAPYCWRGGEDRDELVNPAAAPWIPYVRRGAQHYAVREYDEVEIRQAGDALEIAGEGKLEAYHPVPRWRRALSVLTGRAARAMPVFQSSVLPGLRLRRNLVLDLETGHVKGATRVVGNLHVDATLHQSGPDGPAGRPAVGDRDCMLEVR